MTREEWDAFRHRVSKIPNLSEKLLEISVRRLMPPKPEEGEEWKNES